VPKKIVAWAMLTPKSAVDELETHLDSPYFSQVFIPALTKNVGTKLIDSLSCKIFNTDFVSI
jgi:hypothetical protein